jgi:hypothetical protein
MPWQIKYHEERPASVQIGDMYPAPWLLKGPESSRSYWVSHQYERDWADKRPPLVVRLPGNIDFCIDQGMLKTRDGWLVTGTAPNITLSPSINVSGLYHGWIKDGVITDDCEGRKY